MSKIAKTKENLKKCRCHECPSYTLGCKMKNYPMNFVRMLQGLENANHFEGMFCAYGTSRCIAENNGCLCENCEIYHDYNLNHDEYCLPLNKNISQCRTSKCQPQQQ